MKSASQNWQLPGAVFINLFGKAVGLVWLGVMYALAPEGLPNTYFTGFAVATILTGFCDSSIQASSLREPIDVGSRINRVRLKLSPIFLAVGVSTFAFEPSIGFGFVVAAGELALSSIKFPFAHVGNVFVVTLQDVVRQLASISAAIVVCLFLSSNSWAVLFGYLAPYLALALVQGWNGLKSFNAGEHHFYWRAPVALTGLLGALYSQGDVMVYGFLSSDKSGSYGLFVTICWIGAIPIQLLAQMRVEVFRSAQGAMRPFFLDKSRIFATLLGLLGVLTLIVFASRELPTRGFALFGLAGLFVVLRSYNFWVSQQLLFRKKDGKRLVITALASTFKIIGVGYAALNFDLLVASAFLGATEVLFFVLINVLGRPWESSHKK